MFLQFLASCRRKYPLKGLYSFLVTDEFLKFLVSSPEEQRLSFTKDDNSSQIVSLFRLEKKREIPILTLKLKFLVCFVKYSLIFSSTGKKKYDRCTPYVFWSHSGDFLRCIQPSFIIVVHFDSRPKIRFTRIENCAFKPKMWKGQLCLISADRALEIGAKALTITA